MAMSTRLAPSAAGLALEYFTVQRASRSFWASLAGLEAQASGMRPSFRARSSSVLCCFGAATTVASRSARQRVAGSADSSRRGGVNT
jgi:hypothetical protein